MLRKICQIFQKKNGEQKGLSEKLLICNPVPKADQIFTVLIKKFMVDRKTDELCKLGKQILQLVNQATKGQLILERLWIALFESKYKHEHFCISALASEMGQIIKIMAHYHAN